MPRARPSKVEAVGCRRLEGKEGCMTAVDPEREKQAETTPPGSKSRDGTCQVEFERDAGRGGKESGRARATQAPGSKPRDNDRIGRLVNDDKQVGVRKNS